MRPKRRAFKPKAAPRAGHCVAERKIIQPTQKIGTILEKFHAFGWTASIPPTYCLDEGIFKTDGDIERQGVWQQQGNSIDHFVGLSAFSAPR